MKQHQTKLTGNPLDGVHVMTEDRALAIFELHSAIKNADPEMVYEACKDIDKEQLNRVHLIIGALLHTHEDRCTSYPDGCIEGTDVCRRCNSVDCFCCNDTE